MCYCPVGLEGPKLNPTQDVSTLHLVKDVSPTHGSDMQSDHCTTPSGSVDVFLQV